MTEQEIKRREVSKLLQAGVTPKKNCSSDWSPFGNSLPAEAAHLVNQRAPWRSSTREPVVRFRNQPFPSTRPHSDLTQRELELISIGLDSPEEEAVLARQPLRPIRRSNLVD